MYECVCVCFNSSKITERTSIKLGMIDHLPGVSVIEARDVMMTLQKLN